MSRRLLVLLVNGERREVAAAEQATLLEVLREELDLTGTKHGCGLGECGACTVLVDGVPCLSCLLLAVDLAVDFDVNVNVDAHGPQITTVEGLAEAGRADPLQVAFAELGAAQCGYCSPGMLLSAHALLAGNPVPTTDEIRSALAGNLCRCTGYQQIIAAVRLAVERTGLSSRGGPSDG